MARCMWTAVAADFGQAARANIRRFCARTVPVFATLLALPIAAAGHGVTNAPAIPVDVELVLAVDVSGSIDADEARLQRDGYVAALSSPELADAVRRGMLGRIAVAYVEWSGHGQQQMLVDWTLIEGRASARAFAREVAARPVIVEKTGRTAIGGAIAFAAELLHDNGFEGWRSVIDVSGDGVNNVGHVVSRMRDRAIAGGVTINGLPIINHRPNPSGGRLPRDLAQYYRDCVIGGPGAFLVVADGYDAFGPAIRRKLILEIAGAQQPAPRSLMTLAQFGGSGCLHTL